MSDYNDAVKMVENFLDKKFPQSTANNMFARQILSMENKKWRIGVVDKVSITPIIRSRGGGDEGSNFVAATTQAEFMLEQGFRRVLDVGESVPVEPFC